MRKRTAVGLLLTALVVIVVLARELVASVRRYDDVVRRLRSDDA